ncbi:hypothetical protein FISHEDRAFT_72136 [Fistulina hepatica ATCC 64428]|uniref:F-box domain-containing protein n=1 Tax=Fistulina hepatica ATCC 64428 TaxID=1128425 RepID=A0A0D7AFJ1_9AGAR|nr:hypothetical protein FISHEDRAFT_72136 [Fistulina hepatica ATCC 64428]
MPAPVLNSSSLNVDDEIILLSTGNTVTLGAFLDKEWSQPATRSEPLISMCVHTATDALTDLRNGPSVLRHSSQGGEVARLEEQLFYEVRRLKWIRYRISKALDTPWFWSHGEQTAITTDAREHCLHALSATVHSMIVSVERQITELRFHTSAFRRLPVETLIKIFRYLYPVPAPPPVDCFGCDDDPYPYLAFKQPFLAPVHFAIPHVCKTWRGIVNNCPDLVPGLRITPGVLPGQLEYVVLQDTETWAASNPFPLKIVLQIGRDGYPCVLEDGSEMTSTAIFMNRLLTYASRWKSFTLFTRIGTYEPDVLAEIDKTTDSFDLLEEMVFAITPYEDCGYEERPTLAPFARAPRLTKLTVDCVEPSRPFPYLFDPLEFHFPWEQLQSLTCTGLAYDILKWFEVIRECPNLETLHVKNVKALRNNSRSRAATITLPRLKCLMLTLFTDGDQLLKVLTCPRLRELQFFQAMWTGRTLDAMIQRSKCIIRTVYIADVHFTAIKMALINLIRTTQGVEDFTFDSWDTEDWGVAAVLRDVCQYLSLQTHGTPLYFPDLRRLTIRCPAPELEGNVYRTLAQARVEASVMRIPRTRMEFRFNIPQMTTETRAFLSRLSSDGLAEVYFERMPITVDDVYEEFSSDGEGPMDVDG